MLLVGTHLAYLFEIGGDHFEYRPLDFYWPLLAVPAAEGIARLGGGLSSLVRRWFQHLRWAGPRVLAIVVFTPILFYASAIQAVILFEGTALTKPPVLERPVGAIDDQNAGWLLAAPGMPALVALSNELRLVAEQQFVGLRSHEHRAFGDERIRGWGPYESVHREFVPDDAVTDINAIGIPPYSLASVRFIDTHGLADVTVARNPVNRSSSERRLAHDRSPPPGYLQQRGVNFSPYPAAATEAEALARANYALEVGPGIWMPFNVVDHVWANERFAGHDVRANNRYSQTDPAGNRLTKDGVRYVGEQFLGRFDGSDLDGWHREGKAVTNHALAPYFDRVYPIRGHVGPGFLTTYFPGKWERTGRATSPTFTARDDQYLMFLIAGEPHDHVGMRLLADGEEVAMWRGDKWGAFELVIHPLNHVAGQQLQLEIVNNEVGDRPRLMLDHVMLVRRES